MRIEDIAKKLNISASTISRVLNNSKSVKPETRERILAEIEASGYVPNMIARGLRTRSHTVAVVTQDILNPYYIEALYSIEKVCRENGYALMSLNSDNSPEIEKQNLNQLLSMKVEGVIFLANMLSEHDEDMKRHRASNMAVVTMEGYFEGVDCVISDARTGVRQGMDYLVSMGHKKIGTCHGARRSMPVLTRMQEMKIALEEHGCPYDTRYEFFGDDFIDQLEQARCENRLPTVLFTLNDNTAIQVYRWCRDVSLRIPEDISVLGFDNVTLADLLSPPLTTIAQPIGYLAETAIKLLITRMRAKEPIKHFSNIRVPTELVIRKSVGVCKDA